jgi:hypothetical protein
MSETKFHKEVPLETTGRCKYGILSWKLIGACQDHYHGNNWPAHVTNIILETTGRGKPGTHTWNNCPVQVRIIKETPGRWKSGKLSWRQLDATVREKQRVIKLPLRGTKIVTGTASACVGYEMYSAVPIKRRPRYADSPPLQTHEDYHRSADRNRTNH